MRALVLEVLKNYIAQKVLDLRLEMQCLVPGLEIKVLFLTLVLTTRAGQRVDIINIRLQKVDENVDQPTFGRFRWAFPHSGFGVPDWCWYTFKAPY